MKTLQNKIIMCACAFALLFSYSSVAWSQEEEHYRDPQNTNNANNSQPQIEVGARFMPVFSSFRMTTYDGSRVKGTAVLGYGMSAIIGFNFNSHIGLQTEIIYNSISRKYSEVGVNRKVNLRYVAIPFLLSINSGKFKPVNLNIVVGPQLGIMVGNTVYTSGDVTPETPIAVLTVRKSDIGLAYGAGLDFGLNRSGTFRVGVGFRGVYGLINVSNTSRTRETSEFYVLDKVHVETYSIYGGFSFLF
jgi:hypothetical protein